MRGADVNRSTLLLNLMMIPAERDDRRTGSSLQRSWRRKTVIGSRAQVVRRLATKLVKAYLGIEYK